MQFVGQQQLQIQLREEEEEEEADIIENTEISRAG
jgi:hypothetical protein